tara:strand:- start:6576 stop:7424 length:849 start_codon:yes stop_codon:yes gene_type:complete
VHSEVIERKTMDKIQKSDYHEIRRKANEILEMFTELKVNLHTTSYLYILLSNTIKNFSQENTPFEMFDALYVNRLYDAIMFIHKSNNKKKYLKDITKGTLDFQDRKHSHAKNILFELELAHRISIKFEDVKLDEPDIVVKFADGDVGIACKKVTSNNNLEKQLSKGVKQIKLNGFLFGIVAINIDNLTPEGSILKQDTVKMALDKLHDLNMGFIKKNERHFLKYLKESRLIAVIIHSSVVADIPSASPRFNNLSQTTMWTMKGLEEKLKDKVGLFKVLESTS